MTEEKRKKTHRPDAAHLNQNNYVHSTAITTRYSDLDPQGHLNNVAIAELFEAARLRFLIHMYESVGSRMEESRGVLVSLHINYLEEGSLIDDVVVHSAFGDTGNTSFVIKQLMTQRDSNIATAETTIVRIGDNGPEPIPSQFKDAMTAYQFKG